EDLVDCADAASTTSVFFRAWNVVAGMVRASLSDGLYAYLRDLISPHVTMGLVTYLAQSTGLVSVLPGDKPIRFPPALRRDLPGQPYRPATVDKGWLTWNGEPVSRLATAG